jgi:hypothetical protein
MKADDLRLITAILATSTIRAAAARAGIGEATMYRRLSERAFQARLQEARQQAFGQSLARLQATSGAAVDTLSEIMGNEDAPTGSRVRAAVAVLQLAGRDLERGEVQDRLEGNAKEDAILRGDKQAFLRAGGSDQEYFTYRAARGLFG